MFKYLLNDKTLNNYLHFTNYYMIKDIEKG